MSESSIERVRDALLRGELRAEDLTTRRLCAFLGKTTGILYHHFGSLDGFLFAVGQSGMGVLQERLRGAFQRTHQVAGVAEAFVEFGLDHPDLYRLMFERSFDWSALRAAGAFEHLSSSGSLWDEAAALLDAAGSRDPDTDARILWAGLHGLVSLAASGRANMRALHRSDREVAKAAARALTERILGGPRK